MTRPLLVPSERVRLCPENMGTWGQSREIFQSWDTGKGAVVPARKYSLTPTPDGNVAVVFQDAGDAEKVDQLLGSLSVRPERPLPLRYCSSIKTFCPDSCFASQRDKSCMTHVKPRFRVGAEKPAGAAMAPPVAKRQACPPAPNSPAWPSAPAGSENAWLFDEVLEPLDKDEESDDTAFVDIEGLDEICQPICDLGKFQPKTPRSPATMKPLAPPASLRPPPSGSTMRRGVAPARPANATQKKALLALWNEGAADSNNILSGLSSLLDSDMAPLDNPAHEFWAASLSDVMHDPLLSHGLSVTKPKPKLGRPPLGSKPSGAKPKGAAPGQATFKPFSKIHKEMHKIKGGQPMLHSPPPSKPAAAVKSKVVWKQTVTW